MTESPLSYRAVAPAIHWRSAAVHLVRRLCMYRVTCSSERGARGNLRVIFETSKSSSHDLGPRQFGGAGCKKNRCYARAGDGTLPVCIRFPISLDRISPIAASNTNPRTVDWVCSGSPRPSCPAPTVQTRICPDFPSIDFRYCFWE